MVAPGCLFLCFVIFLMLSFTASFSLVLIVAVVIAVVVLINKDHLLIIPVPVPGIPYPVVFKIPVCMGCSHNHFIPCIYVVM